MLRSYFFLMTILCSGINTLAQTSSSQHMKWRNIGPANMMCRIAAIDALHEDYRHVLVASASGGVFKSTNAGMTWTPIFEQYGAGSIGSVTLNQGNPDIIWVGTGEAANRNSSGWGDGIYKSTDGGKSFEHLGLKETGHIAEIALHPTNPDIAYAAAVGRLWGYSGDRGLFHTKDGGKSWEKLTNGLPDDGKTGCTEIIMDPRNPDVLFAGFYHRIRSAHSMQSGGDNGGIFKSIDGGKSWTKLTSGLPTGATGMIDISIHLNNPDIMVAAVEADENLPKGVPGSGVYKSMDGGMTWIFILKHAMRPFYHGQIEIDPTNPENIYVVSRDFRYSKDGGKTFKKGKPWGWGAGGDDHDLWISPQDGNIMYSATDQGAYFSLDGKSFLAYDNMAIGQFYAIGADMRDPYWVVGGLQDNGIWTTSSNSREYRGILNAHVDYIGDGDGFHAQVDPTDWKTVYAVNHVGFATRFNMVTRKHHYITPNPETIKNYTEVVDPKFDETPIEYTIYPGEHWFGRERVERPKLPAQFRFNWSSPLVLSPHDPNTLFFCGNYVFKSEDRGDSWEIISPDLTRNIKEKRNPSKQGGLTRSVTGGENHCTIISISQSPLDPNVIWVGTDDGMVQLTQDGGKTWKNVRPELAGLPEDTWVSRVEASHHDPELAYVSIDNHRNDDYKPHIFALNDFGADWKSIHTGIPDNQSVYVVKEDPAAPNLLFAGTEMGVYTSLNKGESWERMTNGIPTVAIYDLLIHPRDGDLIVGTHGRSIWIADDIGALRVKSQQNMTGSLRLFQPRVATQWIRYNTGRKQSKFIFRGQNPPPGALLDFEVAEDVDSVDIIIRTTDSTVLFRHSIDANPGMNRFVWNMQHIPSSEDVTTMKTALLKGINTLLEQEGGAKFKLDKTQVKQLKKFRTAVESETNWRTLNAQRKKLIEAYNAYIQGPDFFGEKLQRKRAEPGKYLVQVKNKDQISNAVLTVRADPLMN